MLTLLFACTENKLVAVETTGAGNATTAAPDVEVSPPSVDFGVVDVDASASATITITNVGDATLTVDALALQDDDYDLSFTSVSSPLVVPGAAVDTVVTWTPHGAGGVDDALLVESDDPDESEVAVPLTGTVPVGDIVVDPASYDFGTLDVG